MSEFKEVLTMKCQLDEGAKMPERAHPFDAGMDLFSMEDKTIEARSGAAFDTGFHIELPPGTVGMVKSKSGLFFKHDLFCNGTVDSGYTGSIRVKLVNLGDTPYHVSKGDKIAQLVITPILTPQLVQVDSLSDSERGENGFGSTGK